MDLGLIEIKNTYQALQMVDKKQYWRDWAIIAQVREQYREYQHMWS